MKRFSRYTRYAVILLIFIIFNCILLSSLREEKTPESDIKPKIVLISHVYSNPYWQSIRLGAEKAAKERNAVVEYQGPDSASSEEGIKFINMAYAARVSGIITYVQDGEKYKPVIDKVVKGGVPLVTVDSDSENSKRLCYVGTDNIMAGSIAARELISKIGMEGKVAVIVGGKNVKNQIERVEGFKDYINKNSKLSIEAVESSDSYLLEAELAAKKIIMDNSDIKAIFCTSALDGVGASKAVIKLGVAGKVKIVCFDDLPETLEGIRNGSITSTIVQKPSLMGYNSVNIIMDIIEGKETNGLFLTDVLVLSKENLEQYEKEQGEYASETQQPKK